MTSHANDQTSIKLVGKLLSTERAPPIHLLDSHFPMTRFPVGHWSPLHTSLVQPASGDGDTYHILGPPLSATNLGSSKPCLFPRLHCCHFFIPLSCDFYCSISVIASLALRLFLPLLSLAFLYLARNPPIQLLHFDSSASYLLVSAAWIDSFDVTIFFLSLDHHSTGTRLLSSNSYSLSSLQWNISKLVSANSLSQYSDLMSCSQHALGEVVSIRLI